jgi:hypothetical protein
VFREGESHLHSHRHENRTSHVVHIFLWKSIVLDVSNFHYSLWESLLLRSYRPTTWRFVVCFTSRREASVTPWVGCWVGCGPGLDAWENRKTITSTGKRAPVLLPPGPYTSPYIDWATSSVSAVTVTSLTASMAVGIVARYGMVGPGIQSGWGRDFPDPSRLAPRPPSLL